MGADSSELLQGTLELLILKTLSLEPMHGWGISQRIQQVSGDVFQVNQGSLYPALQRMKMKGWVTSEWRTTENSRRARYYMLTPVGRAQLARERSAWERSSSAVNLILEWGGGAA
jgi:PadR family transcriptional regulator, regulatory protein PadR